MRPLQVQFCYYVARGNAEKAQSLLPGMVKDRSLFNGARTPAIFCLWAAKQPDRLSVLSKLAELYPNVAPPRDAQPALPASIEDTVCKVLVPAVQPHLHQLLSAILKATPKEIRADYHDSDGFEILSCAAALKFILAHQAFKNKTAEWQTLTTKVLSQLVSLTKLQLQATSEPTIESQCAPDSVKAVLNEKTDANRFKTLFPTVKKTPTTPTTEDDKENATTPEKTDHKLLATANGPGFFTSRPLHGRQSVSADTVTPNLHGSTPPPAPKCVHQALSLVAKRPTVRKPQTSH